MNKKFVSLKKSLKHLKKYFVYQLAFYTTIQIVILSAIVEDFYLINQLNENMATCQKITKNSNHNNYKQFNNITTILLVKNKTGKLVTK